MTNTIVKIYTTPTCQWCKKTKDWLKQNNIKYTEKNVAKDRKARQEIIKKSGQTGVPVIDIKGKIIIGFDPKEIQKALSKNSEK